MKVLSSTHTIVAPVSADCFCYIAEEVRQTTAATHISHPPGTVLDLDDVEAETLVECGTVVKYDAGAHGVDPAAIAAWMRQGSGSAPTQGARHA